MDDATSLPRHTVLNIDGERFLLDGQPTYRGRADVEGMLYNIRTVNATFDDTLGRCDYFDDDGSHAENRHAGYGPWMTPASAEANTDRFIAALPQYRRHGILAIDLCMQGGHPLQGKTWLKDIVGSANRGPNAQRGILHNSAFDAVGAIDPLYAARIGRVIDACNQAGMAVILCLFYFGQDTVFTDEDAIRAAVDAAIDWICARGDRNVVIEIANEVMRGHFHHAILKPDRIHELIEQAKARATTHGRSDLSVSTSEAALLSEANWSQPAEADRVFAASDLILLHGGDGIDHGDVGDRTEVARKIEFIRSRPWFKSHPRPIVFNESDGRLAFEAALQRRASFGLHSTPYLQTVWPQRWGVWAQPVKWFFERVQQLTGGA